MRLFITKFRASDGEVYNYFDSANPMNVIDWIQINNFLEIPEFDDEFDLRGDVFQKKANFKSFRLSLMQSETSNLGKTIETFLFDPDNLNNFFHVIIQDPDEYNRYGAYIDLENMRKNLLPDSKGYYIEIECLDMLKELSRHGETRAVHAITGLGTTFDTHLTVGGGDNLFTGFQNVNITNQLDIASKVGFMPIVSKSLLAGIWYSEESQWSAFLNTCLTFGIAFKLMPYTGVLPYGNVSYSLLLFWRTTGINTTTIQPLLEDVYETISLLDCNRFLMIPTIKVTYTMPDNPQFSHYGGLLMTKDWFRIVNVHQRSPYLPYSEWKIGLFYWHTSGKRFDLSLFSDYSYPKDWAKDYQPAVNDQNVLNGGQASGGTSVAVGISYARIFVQTYETDPHPLERPYWDTGFMTILQKTTVSEYRFMLRGAKLMRELTVECTDNKLVSGNTTTWDSYNWLINRVKNKSFVKNTGKIELIEI